MKAWIIAIVGIVVLGVLLEIILSDGEVTKYIRGIFSIIVVVVIISPIAQMLSGNKKFEFNIDGSQLECNDDYVKYFYAEQKLSDEKMIENALTTAKILPQSVEIITKDAKSYKIKSVKLSFLKASSINKTKAIDIVKKHFGNVEVIIVEQ
ncbi:MAG: stage III sporulation protein AF [Clostridia bacterium]